MWWWITSPAALSQEARTAISAPGTWLSVSVATVWELEIKQAGGKLDLTSEFWPTVRTFADAVLAITEEDAVAAARLPLHHRDPFDRMILAQAGRRGLTVTTRDTLLRNYDVPILWA